MATEFNYEHVFRAPDTATVIAAYFDADHNAKQDVLAELAERTIVEESDTAEVHKVTWRVHSQKPLPVFARPFVDGGRLTYVETMTHRKAADEIDLSIVPQIMKGRVTVNATYKLEKIGDNQIRRRYSGAIAVGIPLLSGKIERAIASEIEKGMSLMVGVTEKWLAERVG